MDYRTKHSVIATLIKAGRRDLARIIAGIKTTKRPPSSQALMQAPSGSQLNWMDQDGTAYVAERLSDTTWEIRSGGELVDEVYGTGALIRYLNSGTDFFWD